MNKRQYKKHWNKKGYKTYKGLRNYETFTMCVDKVWNGYISII